MVTIPMLLNHRPPPGSSSVAAYCELRKLQRSEGKPSSTKTVFARFLCKGRAGFIIGLCFEGYIANVRSKYFSEDVLTVITIKASGIMC